MTWFDFGLFSSNQVQFTAPSELHQRVACAPSNHFQFNKAKPTHLCRFGLVAVIEINEYYSICILRKSKYSPVKMSDGIRGRLYSRRAGAASRGAPARLVGIALLGGRNSRLRSGGRNIAQSH